MKIDKNQKSGGYLLIACGAAFATAAVFSEQLSFFGIAAMFILLGIAFILKHNNANT
ncbi:hypothetical protein [Flocculibacter collagenilyticus]|uniref:hypothetical protein n=1 Tax=Flocculibacter collagenilyticus TaxID=2744479 RepID=UPI0018F2CCA2|nr:hypothetical protein [Flocculibacter collagenilyticus]